MSSHIKILHITNMFPNSKRPEYGAFIKSQILSTVKKGIKVDVLFINGYSSKFNYIRALIKILKLNFSRKKYDLLHAHYGVSGIIARFQLRYKLLVSFCGSDVLGVSSPISPELGSSKTSDKHWQKRVHSYSGFPPFLISILSNLMVLSSLVLCRIVDSVIVKTIEMKEKLRRYDAHVIPNGVNFTHFKTRTKAVCRNYLGLETNKSFVLFIGNPERTDNRKRYDLAEDSVKFLKKNVNEAELLVVFGVPQKLIPLYMNASDVLLLTSDFEGSPNAVKEAMACNLPVVSVDVGDVRKVIENTEGCFITSRDPKDISMSLNLAIKNGKTKGRDDIRHLESSVVAENLIKIYEDII